ncbi:MAG: alpha/beta hydrolase family protein, partial [Actinomycetota bacterium]
SGGVQLLGISYGGSFALIAAGDERIAADIRQVATFGAYFDLVGVIQAVTTGSSLVDGKRLAWEAHPRAKEVLENVAVRLASEDSREELRSALDGEGDGVGLRGGTRPLFRLLRNDDPARTFELAGELPEDMRTILRRFSPSSVASRIEVPVAAMHSTDDPAVPYGELLRLMRAMPATRSVTVSLFRHVDFTLDSPGDILRLAADAVSTWRFSSWFLSPQG